RTRLVLRRSAVVQHPRWRLELWARAFEVDTCSREVRPHAEKRIRRKAQGWRLWQFKRTRRKRKQVLRGRWEASHREGRGGRERRNKETKGTGELRRRLVLRQSRRGFSQGERRRGYRAGRSGAD